MNAEMYQDRYKATVPKVIDYGCIAAAVLLFWTLCALHFRWFFLSLLLLAVPFLLSCIPGRIYCSETAVLLQDLYHGKTIIPMDSIRGTELRVIAHKEGIGAFLPVHHYIIELKLITDTRTYRYRMDAGADAIDIQFPGHVELEKSKSRIPFLKVRKYIETTQYLNQL